MLDITLQQLFMLGLGTAILIAVCIIYILSHVAEILNYYGLLDIM